MRSVKTIFRNWAALHPSPDWTHGAIGSRAHSSFSMWECLALLALPVAALGFVAMAAAIGVVRLT